MPLTARAIVQCGKDGKDIRSFESAEKACKTLGILNRGHLYKAIKYGLICRDFRWRWADSPLVKPQSYDMRGKAVIAIQGEDKKRYKNVAEASRATGATVSSIQQAILTGGMAKGYRFKLVGSKAKPIAKRSPKVLGVVSLNEKGKAIKRWPSVIIAAIELGVSPSAVYYAVHHPGSKCQGFRLKYATC